MSETAMAEAFTRAGYVPSRDRLTSIAFEAWARWSSASDTRARRDYVAGALMGERTWSLMEQFQPRALEDAIEQLLRGTARVIAAERPAQQPRYSPSGEGPRREGGRPYPPREPMRTSATARPSLADLSAKHRAATLATAGLAVRLSMLDKFKVNGIPVGDCTAEGALAWASSQRGQARYVELLVAGVPPGIPIRKFRTPEEADALYREVCGA